MIEILHTQVKTLTQPCNAAGGEEPEVLGWRHQPPSRSGPAGGCGAEIAGGEHDQSAWIELSRAQRQGFARCGEMLDDIEQHDNVHPAELRESLHAGCAVDNAQAVSPAICRRIFGQLDTGYIEIALCFLEKETVRAAYLEKPSRWAALPDELYRAGKLPAQYALASEIIRVAVHMSAGKIRVGVIGGRIERIGFGAPQSALPTNQDVAAIL